jgi:hypothetical protein
MKHTFGRDLLCTAIADNSRRATTVPGYGPCFINTHNKLLRLRPKALCVTLTQHDTWTHFFHTLQPTTLDQSTIAFTKAHNAITTAQKVPVEVEKQAIRLH